MSASPYSAVDVQIIMADIRRRARAENQRRDEALRRARRTIGAELTASVSRLRGQAGAIRSSAARIGDLPPSPPSLRGKLGAIAVRLLRRALFWIIPSLQSTQQQVADALENHARALDELIKSVEQTNVKLELLLEAQASNADRPLSARVM